MMKYIPLACALFFIASAADVTLGGRTLPEDISWVHSAALRLHVGPCYFSTPVRDTVINELRASGLDRNQSVIAMAVDALQSLPKEVEVVTDLVKFGAHKKLIRPIPVVHLFGADAPLRFPLPDLTDGVHNVYWGGNRSGEWKTVCERDEDETTAGGFVVSDEVRAAHEDDVAKWYTDAKALLETSFREREAKAAAVAPPVPVAPIVPDSPVAPVVSGLSPATAEELQKMTPKILDTLGLEKGEGDYGLHVVSSALTPSGATHVRITARDKDMGDMYIDAVVVMRPSDSGITFEKIVNPKTRRGDYAVVVSSADEQVELAKDIVEVTENDDSDDDEEIENFNPSNPYRHHADTAGEDFNVFDTIMARTDLSAEEKEDLIKAVIGA